jgi:hypothetical protein
MIFSTRDIWWTCIFVTYFDVLCRWRRRSDCWLVLLQSSPVVTTRNYYTVTHLHGLQSLHANSPFYLFGASGIHLETSKTLSENCSSSKSHCDWWSVSHSVRKYWCRPPPPSGAHDQIFFTVWHLRSCFCGAPSLTRGRVSLLYMLLALASAVFLGSESLGTRDHILLSQTRDFPFRRLLRLARSRWRYSTPPPHGSPRTVIFVTGVL